VAQVTKKKKVVKEDPRKTPSPAEKKIPGRTPLSQRPETQPKAQAPQQRQEDTIVPRGKHPEQAVYVARDKKSGAEVSFDSWGRKLDSLGHVVHGDRQRAGDAGAKAIYRPPPPPEPAKEPEKAKLTGLLSPGRGSTAPYRRDWDRALVPGGSTLANRGFPDSPAPVLEPGATPVGRELRPGVLAPGGIDPATGQKYPTARNGLLEGGADNSVPVPSGTGGSFGGFGSLSGWRPEWTQGLEDFVSGNNPYSPVQPKVNVPSFGQLPANIMQQTQSYVPPPSLMPAPLEIPRWMRPAEDFMAGNSQWSPVQPKVNIPGFGQLPQSALSRYGR
jgi:hypothetical protein